MSARSAAHNALPESGGVRLAQLIGLASFGLLWPLLDLWKRFPEFLVVHGASWTDVLLLSAFLALGLPLLIWAVGLALERRSPAWAWRWHLISCGTLVAIVVVVPFGRLDELPGPLPIVAALVVGALFALAMGRFPVLRSLVAIYSLSLPIYLGIFFGDASVRRALSIRPVRVDSGVSRAPNSGSATAPVSGTRVGADVAGRASPVVLLVLDELPTASLVDEELQVDAEHYPNFARLASSSTWYRAATTVSPLTLESVTAVLTGLYPSPDLRSTLVDHPVNLFTLLWGEGQIHASEPRTHLLPDSRDQSGAFHMSRGEFRLLVQDSAMLLAHMITPPAYRDELPPVNHDWIGFADQDPLGDHPAMNVERKVQELRAWIQGIEPGQNLYFAHTVLPHYPFRYYPSGVAYSEVGRNPSEARQWHGWEGGEWAIVHEQQRHLLQTGFIDLILGELIDRLESQDLFDRSLIVLTADHGMSYRRESPPRALDAHNGVDILRVPLFVKLPGQQRAIISDAPVETVDIVPTILEWLGRSTPSAVDGVSLLSQPAPARTVARFMDPEPRDIPIEKLASLGGSLDQRRARFAEDDRYLIGRHELLGSPVSDFFVSDSDRAVSLVAGALEARIEPGDRLWPGELIGDIQLERDERLVELVIAVDDTLRVSTRNYLARDGQPRSLFSAVIPEAALGPGKHRIEIFEVEELSPGQVRLLRLDPTY